MGSGKRPGPWKIQRKGGERRCKERCLEDAAEWRLVGVGVTEKRRVGGRYVKRQLNPAYFHPLITLALVSGRWSGWYSLCSNCKDSQLPLKHSGRMEAHDEVGSRCELSP